MNRPLTKRLAALAAASGLLCSCVLADDAQLNQLAQRGLAWRRALEAQEVELRREFVRLDQAINRIVDDNLDGERLTIIHLRRVVALMRKQAAEVGDAHRRMLDKTSNYGELVQEAAPLLLAAAGKFDGYAAEEPYESLRENYRLWGESFTAIATKYQQQAEYVAPTISTVRTNLDYVKRTELQLSRVERLLDIIPEEGVGTEEFLTRLTSYIDSFRALRERLRSLHGRTFGKDGSPPQRSDAPQPPRAAPSILSDQTVDAGRATLNVQGASGSFRLAAARTTTVKSAKTTSHGAPYLGKWLMGTSSGRVPLEVYSDGGTLRLRLAGSHRLIKAVEGTLTSSRTGARIWGLVYVMRTGERLRLSRVEILQESQDVLSIKCPVVAGTHHRGFRVTSQRTECRLQRVR